MDRIDLKELQQGYYNNNDEFGLYYKNNSKIINEKFKTWKEHLKEYIDSIEDLYQDIMLFVVEAYHNNQNYNNLEEYLQWRLIDKLKYYKRLKRSINKECLDIEELEDIAEENKNTYTTEDYMTLSEAYNTLTDNEKKIFYYHTVKGLSFEKIGEQINLTRQTVSVRYKKIQAKLDSLITE